MCISASFPASLTNAKGPSMSDLERLAEALCVLLLDGDHSRGCEGRHYNCECGYDDQVYDQARALRAIDLAHKDTEAPSHD